MSNSSETPILTDIAIIGSGMGSLSTAALLVSEGYKVTIIEQNYLPGGCTSSYYRKGFTFETGATTLIGLDDNMPLNYILKKTGIELDEVHLTTPMIVRLKNGTTLTRYQDIDRWISEAQSVFGEQGQRGFWQTCYSIAKKVWQTSLKQLHFPPQNITDIKHLARNFKPNQLVFATKAFQSMKQLLKQYNLDKNKEFIDFIDEQLLITAQNTHEQVNVLFGSTSLCYTNFNNYYINGGMIEMIKKFCTYIESKGSKIIYRTAVKEIVKSNGNYLLKTSKGNYLANRLISGIPLNNTLDLWSGNTLKHLQKKVLKSESLNSAFQMGIGFRKEKNRKCLHYQLHLPKSISFLDSKSLFLSFSHPEDTIRCESDKAILSISTHLKDPQNSKLDKSSIENEIINLLEQQNIIRRDQIIYYHSSSAKSWANWTGRKYGFVGGYPQFMKIKPWQMVGSRLDGKKAYLCGDTSYPGQGIPGVCLSGIIAFEKMKADGL